MIRAYHLSTLFTFLGPIAASVQIEPWPTLLPLILSDFGLYARPFGPPRVVLSRGQLCQYTTSILPCQHLFSTFFYKFLPSVLATQFLVFFSQNTTIKSIIYCIKAETQSPCPTNLSMRPNQVGKNASIRLIFLLCRLSSPY